MYAPEMTYIGIDPSLFHDPFTDFAAVPDYINDRLAQFQNGSERIFKNLTQTELDVKLIKNPPVRDIVNGKVDIMADVFAERFSVWKRAMPGGGNSSISETAISSGRKTNGISKSYRRTILSARKTRSLRDSWIKYFIGISQGKDRL